MDFVAHCSWEGACSEDGAAVKSYDVMLDDGSLGEVESGTVACTDGPIDPGTDADVGELTIGGAVLGVGVEMGPSGTEVGCSIEGLVGSVTTGWFTVATGVLCSCTTVTGVSSVTGGATVGGTGVGVAGRGVGSTTGGGVGCTTGVLSSACATGIATRNMRSAQPRARVSIT